MDAVSGSVGLSIVIVNWNLRDGLARCLDSIVAQRGLCLLEGEAAELRPSHPDSHPNSHPQRQRLTLGSSTSPKLLGSLRNQSGEVESSADAHIVVETIVVDNGSQDGSAELLATHYPWVRLIQTGSNLGFAEGCNRGLAQASGDWVFTLNNDSVLAPGCLAELCAAACHAAPHVGMLQTCIVFAQHPDLINSTGLLLFDDGSARDRDFNEPAANCNASHQVFAPTAGAAFYRRSMLEALHLRSGVFDRQFFMYMEDVDLGWRARLAGWEAQYVATAQVFHQFQGSSRRRGHGWVVQQCRLNRVRMMIKNASWSFISNTALKTARDLRATWREGGLSALYAFIAAALVTLPARREVTRRARIARQTIEHRWTTPPLPALERHDEH
jgi:GT2 family glycosyltransferase